MSKVGSKFFSLRRFLGSRDGQVAIIFGAAILPTVFFVGSAVDYGRAMRTKTTLQAATDSAALAGATLLAANENARKQLATNTFKANLPSWLAGKVTPSVTSTLSSVTVTVSYNQPTAFMKLAKVASIPLSTSANVLIDTTVTDGNICLLALNTELSPNLGDGRAGQAAAVAG